MIARNITLAGLPPEILFKIFSYLSPETIAEVAFVAELKYTAFDDLFWKEKFQRHFPHVYDPSNVSWYEKFCKAYVEEYKNLPAPVKRLFSLIKEGDVESLQDWQVFLDIFNAGKFNDAAEKAAAVERLKNNPGIHDLLRTVDSNGKSLLRWIQQIDNQQVLNFFYKNPCFSYMADWSVACHINKDFASPRFSINYHIHSAAREGHMVMVRALIEKNPALLEAPNSFSETPLLLAAANGQTKVVAYLLGKGANVHATTTNPGHQGHDMTSLYWAVQNNHADVAELLIKAGAPDTIALGVNQLQPVHIAAQNGCLHMVRALMENKPRLLEITCIHSQTPLHLAVTDGNTSVAGYLISKGANKNAAINHPGHKSHGKTPLMLAVDKQREDIAALLIRAGAEIPAGLIHNMIIKEASLDLLKILVEKKPEVINEIDDSCTPLFMAVLCERYDLVKYLLGKRAWLNVTRLSDGKTMLYIAAENGKNKIFNILLKYGATPDPSIPMNKSGLNPKVKARLALVEFLAKKPSKSRCFTFFAKSQKEHKAAQEMKRVYMNGADENSLAPYQKAIRNNRKLKSIQRSLCKNRMS